jgi:hypothetical protein
MTPYRNNNTINFNVLTNGTQFAMYLLMISLYSTQQNIDFTLWHINLALQAHRYICTNTSSTYEASFTRGPETTLLSAACKWQKEKAVENPPPNTSAAFSPA